MANAKAVRAWREEIAIPTYHIGEPDRNPMFLEKRVYQGSSGAVYPLPMIDRIENTALPKMWNAVFLENEYLKLMMLPQLGGRVQMALDKTNNYHFIYYNRVIKPALVGLTGPWISGGIEFNWPQHHRPSTFSPVDCEVEEHVDGSITVWMHEIDRMYGTRGTHGLRLRPGRAVLEVDVRLSNRTQLPQTFLWWANPAVHVDDDHQSIFPPDVQAVTDHGKRDVSEFPIARSTYYKIDYSPGTDISRYRNIPVPTSYMAYHSDYDFLGSYDHGRQAGLLHVADHHVSPGKKQWTWGFGEFGQAWDRQLTDEDGPYIELMCGVYADNQPDFSWLAPGEEKRFIQNFMPYKGVGVVKNATTDAAIGYELEGERICVRVCAMAKFSDAKLMIGTAADVLDQKLVDLTPAQSIEVHFELSPEVDPHDLRIRVSTYDDRELVSCSTNRIVETPIPEPAQAIKDPQKLFSVESLCIAGKHLEQYRHATREPADYYAEALRREPESIQANDAMGLLLMRRGRFSKAECRFKQAVASITRHNPNPTSSSTLYHLGLCLSFQEKFDDAYDAFAKSAWTTDCRAAARFEMARIAVRRESLLEANRLLDEVLVENSRHHQAIHLKVCVLALCGRVEEAATLSDREIAEDPFNFGVLFERSMQTGDWHDYDFRTRGDLNTYLELSLDYAAAGLYARATKALDRAVVLGAESPLVWYYQARFQRQLGQHAESLASLKRAQTTSLELCFPNKLVEISILQAAEQSDSNDSYPPYLLGLLWYDRRQAELAIESWERARDLNPSFPTVWRNLGLAYFNKRNNADAAWESYQRAFELDSTDARVLFELDQLAKQLGHNPSERLERLESHPALVEARDDLSLEKITLLNCLGRAEAALDAFQRRSFRPWEGGEGKTSAQYVTSLLALVRQALFEEQPDKALDLLNQAEEWPESIGEGRLSGPSDSQVGYLRGVALLKLGNVTAANAVFKQSSHGSSEVGNPMYYNDRPPEHLLYQGLSLAVIGHEAQARQRFRQLLKHGQDHFDDDVEIDFFAVSLPNFLVFEDDLGKRNRVHCNYVQGLGHLGLAVLDDKNMAVAANYFQLVLSEMPDHLGAILHAQFCANRRCLGLIINIPAWP